MTKEGENSSSVVGCQRVGSTIDEGAQGLFVVSTGEATENV